MDIDRETNVRERLELRGVIAIQRSLLDECLDLVRIDLSEAGGVQVETHGCLIADQRESVVLDDEFVVAPLACLLCGSTSPASRDKGFVGPIEPQMLEES